MKIIFLEGLPGIGKTTLINKIKNLNIDNVFVVEEILEKCDDVSQQFFMNNDINKVSKYKNGTIVIDRGAISTLSYNECLKLICGNKDLGKVHHWFDNYFKDLYAKENVKTLYLRKINHNYLLRYENELDPYGSIKNQDILNDITINNIKKYCTNYKIINLNEYSEEELLNEIIN